MKRLIHIICMIVIIILAAFDVTMYYRRRELFSELDQSELELVKYNNSLLQYKSEEAYINANNKTTGSIISKNHIFTMPKWRQISKGL